MKTGIVTIFDNTNLGNRLQNYALHKSLSEYATGVVTIKNKPKEAGFLHNLVKSSPTAEWVFANRIFGKRKKAAILAFNKRHIIFNHKTHWCNTACQKRPPVACDLYCAGSDQIWNPAIGRGQPFDFLRFAEVDSTFSYAASFGVDQISAEHAETVRQGLQHIKHLSVREEAGKRIVEELTGRTDVHVHVDPTMLLTMQQWDEIAQKPTKALPSPYLLTYFLGSVSEKRKAAIAALADSRQCAVINLMDPADPFHAIGPGEFVYLIKHADCVCTDSFHGSVFSFLYGRPLAILPREDAEQDMGGRLTTLSEKFYLQTCVTNDDDLSTFSAQPDYTAGYAVLEQERKKAKAYLRTILLQAERAELCD